MSQTHPVMGYYSSFIVKETEAGVGFNFSPLVFQTWYRHWVSPARARTRSVSNKNAFTLLPG